eukprot:5077852-Amphidinium_carterae.1
MRSWGWLANNTIPTQSFNTLVVLGFICGNEDRASLVSWRGGCRYEVAIRDVILWMMVCNTVFTTDLA